MWRPTCEELLSRRHIEKVSASTRRWLRQARLQMDLTCPPSPSRVPGNRQWLTSHGVPSYIAACQQQQLVVLGPRSSPPSLYKNKVKYWFIKFKGYPFINIWLTQKPQKCPENPEIHKNTGKVQRNPTVHNHVGTVSKRPSFNWPHACSLAVAPQLKLLYEIRKPICNQQQHPVSNSQNLNEGFQYII